MAKFSDVNTIGTGAAAMFRYKAVKKAAGWTITRSSDGTTHNTSGDQITHGGSGANGMANNGAYFVEREPGGLREWTHQRNQSGNNTAWRIKYSALARFTGGSPGVVQTPSATDEQIILGGGTDASPTYASLFNTDSSYRIHIIANSTPIGGVYPFLMFGTTSPGSVFNSGALWQEPMAPGSYDPAAADPCVVGAGGLSGVFAALLTTSKCWFAYGTGSQVWVSPVTGVNATFTGALPADLVSGKDVNGRPLYTGSSGGTRVKGYGATIAIAGPSRAYPATANRTTDAYVYLGGLAVPYPDNTEPGV